MTLILSRPLDCCHPALQAQAAEAAQQLAEANSRYRTALEQLQAERARADALQVCSAERSLRVGPAVQCTL